MADKKSLFGFVAKEGEIQNIDELCKTVDLEENLEPEGVHIQILRSE